jgi:hypothetical protein
LQNAGQVIWTGGTIIANNGSRIDNQPEALFQITDGSVLRTSQGSMASFQNFGRLRKAESGSTTELRASFTNAGTVTARSGTLRFSESFKQSAGETRLEGGTLRFDVAEIEGGQLGGRGTIQGDVINGSLLSPGGQGIGTLTIEGNYVQRPGGRILFEISGLNPGTEFDLLVITRKATLEGTVVVTFTENFLPVIGNTFAVLEYASHEGTASLTDLTLALEPDYSASMLTLITEREPEVFEPVVLEIRPNETEGFTIFFEGQEGREYELQGTTDLVNWIKISDETGAGQIASTDVPPENIHHRFYRVLVR